MSHARIFLQFLRNTSGTSAVEFSIICLPLILVSLGIIEFGRALNIRNDMSFAADIAERKILLGQEMDAATPASEVEAEIEPLVKEAFTGGVPDRLDVSVVDETVDGVAYRRLSLRYPLELIVPGLGFADASMGVTRRIPVQ